MKKTIKSVISLALVLAMVLTMGICAFAEAGDSAEEPIEVYNPMFAPTTIASIPAGETVYYSFDSMFDGKIITATSADLKITVNSTEYTAVDGVVSATLEAKAMTIPVSFTNTSTTDAITDLALTYADPIGSMGNPEVIDPANFYSLAVDLPAYSEYFYTYEMQADGYFYVIPSQYVEMDITITNVAESIQASSMDGDYNPITVAGKKGDKIEIVVASGAEAASDYLSAGEGGTEDAYIRLINTEFMVNVPAGEKMYLAGAFFNMILTIEDAENIVVWFGGDTYAPADGVITVDIPASDFQGPSFMAPPAIITIVNSNADAADVSGEFTYHVGHRENPEILENLKDIDMTTVAGEDSGYYYEWTSTIDGTVSYTVDGDDKDNLPFDIALYNENTWEQVTFYDAEVENGKITISIDVSVGDVLSIAVCAAPGDDWSFPATEVYAKLNGDAVPPTGDSLVNVLLIATVAVVALTSCAVVVRRKKIED